MYLDTSALFKRYVREQGSTSLDHLFSRAESQQIQLTFSAWNIGEVIGALDERHRKKQLTKEEFTSALSNFSDETVRLARQGSVQVFPVSGRVLLESWEILRKEHIYQADALQLSSCKQADCYRFISADRALLESAHRQKLVGLNPIRDGKQILSL